MTDKDFAWPGGYDSLTCGVNNTALVYRDLEMARRRIVWWHVYSGEAFELFISPSHWGYRVAYVRLDGFGERSVPVIDDGDCDSDMVIES